ncbi:MAG: ABC transporter substrate-binding protein [Acidimicrobiaceae bacterium]|nr:ABC transporter substrate-binding protein [Acidimicrobiaceae bacterium]
MALVVALTLSATAVQAAGAKTVRAAGPKAGGKITESVTGGLWPTLDPATDNQDAADSQWLSLIYGELFQAGPGGKLLPDLATGYHYSHNGLQLDITIRPGVKFSDGNPLTAAVAAWSLNRDLAAPIAQIDFPNFAVVKKPIVSSGNTLILNMKSKDAALAQAFVGSAPNWVVDRVALNKMGTKAYDQKPIGAGPFMVASNAANSTINLVRNPGYWQKGHPYLSAIKVVSVGDDSSAYSAMQSGQVQIADFFANIPLVLRVQKSKQFNVIIPPSTFYQFVSLNQTKPPFNNIKAREALYYATDAPLLVKKLYSNFYPVVEGPTAPGELFFYGPKVPGYLNYNLAKAKALVKQVGGINFSLATTSNSSYWSTEATALKQQWAAAGINAKIVLNNLTETLQQLGSNNWQALDSNWGGNTDPGLALPYYFSSKGGATGIHSAALDNLMNKGISTFNPEKRANIYKQIGEMMAKNADAVFLYDKPFLLLAAKNIGWLPTHAKNYGEILWQDVYLNS